MLSSTAFQIVSIEPTKSLVPVVNQAAKRHALSVDFGDSKMFNAPMCGIEYHVQQINLSGSNENQDCLEAIENCLQEIETIADQSLADGYMELL